MRDNCQLSPAVPVAVLIINALIGLGVKCLEFSCNSWAKINSLRTICLEGSTERSDGNRVRSARIGEPRTMCLEFSCKRAQSRTCSGYAECSRKSRRSGTTPQDLPQSPLIALVQISATDPVAIPVAHCLRVHSCNSWKKTPRYPKVFFAPYTQFLSPKNPSTQHQFA